MSEGVRTDVESEETGEFEAAEGGEFEVGIVEKTRHVLWVHID